jgi:hypothetical protein
MACYAFDIDGTIDTAPDLFQAIMVSLKAAGHRVVVMTGIGANTVDDDDITEKRQFLQSLGIGQAAYDALICVPQPHPENKAKMVQDQQIVAMFDNRKANCKAVAPYCTTFLLWNSRTK